MFRFDGTTAYIQFSDRLRLRAVRPDYWDGLHVAAWRDSPEARAAFFDSQVVTPDSHIAFVRSKSVHDLVWMAETLTGELIGMAGLTVDAAQHTGEAGRYFVDPAYRGQGYALELDWNVLAFGFDILRLWAMWLDAWETNTAIIACHEKAGWRSIGTDLDGHRHVGGPVRHMALLYCEWPEHAARFAARFQTQHQVTMEEPTWFPTG